MIAEGQRNNDRSCLNEPISVSTVYLQYGGNGLFPCSNSTGKV